MMSPDLASPPEQHLGYRIVRLSHEQEQQAAAIEELRREIDALRRKRAPLSHGGIRSGCAIVTTNFDSMVEGSLDAFGAAHVICTLPSYAIWLSHYGKPSEVENRMVHMAVEDWGVASRPKLAASYVGDRIQPTHSHSEIVGRRGFSRVATQALRLGKATARLLSDTMLGGGFLGLGLVSLWLAASST